MPRGPMPWTRRELDAEPESAVQESPRPNEHHPRPGHAPRHYAIGERLEAGASKFNQPADPERQSNYLEWQAPSRDQSPED